MRAGPLLLFLGAMVLLGGPALAEQRPLVQRVTADSGSEAGFRAWVTEFRPRALKAGIHADVFDAAFRGAHFDPAIIDRDRNQNEFTKQIWDYLDTAVSDQRVENGKAALKANRKLMSEIERRYGVKAEVVVAIWGLESAYGTYRGSTPVIDALATLAYEGRRGSFFEGQLISALRILQHGDVSLKDFTGSWAGAMGHTQFMPSSWAEYAVDFTGDGKRDVWSDNPADALASTAAYLAKHGWKTGQPWGMEVSLPIGFDYALTGERITKSADDWTALGVRRPNGKRLPDNGPVSILLPAGWQGPAFAIYHNFHVIERYNTADAYVIAVGVLSDRLRGGAGIQHSWPRNDRALSYAEKREMQKRLAAKGFDPGGVDGIMGPNTIQAVRRFQASEGMVPDGYGSLDILSLLRQ